MKSHVPGCKIAAQTLDNERLRLRHDSDIHDDNDKYEQREVKNIIPPASIQEAMEKQMRAERERRESILIAEGQKQSAILVAEGKKTATILEAEAQKEAAIKAAEGEAEAIRAVQSAKAEGIRMINAADANESFIKLRALEAFEKASDGQATKIIIPSEIQGLAGLVTSVAELAKDANQD
ncbi:MAG: hypothetical protein Pg6C_20560 [Treponemataceae bacterium]|nr:MAG: hypothetical protein Pg6C_20560 [Treponemataceae bacterium]